jgi:hypothetical protein
MNSITICTLRDIAGRERLFAQRDRLVREHFRELDVGDLMACTVRTSSLPS